MVTALTIHQRVLRFTAIRKALMTAAGLILIVFLLVHMYGNLRMFVGYEALDHYVYWLKGASEDGGILYLVMSEGQFIRVFRAALPLAVALHIRSAVTLLVKTIKNRGNKHQVTKRQAQIYASHTIHWDGVIILVFVILHLTQFTIIPGILEGDDAKPHAMVVAGLQQWWITAFYAFSVALVCMHIRYGLWSALATPDGNFSADFHKWLSTVAPVVFAVLYARLIIMPLRVQSGILE